MKTQTLIEDPTRASRYLADQLTDAECAAYESRLIADPEAVAELEATARLKIGLQRLRRSGELSELLAGSSQPRPSRTWMLAMAATIAAVVIGMSLWYPRPGPLSVPVLASAANAFKDRSGHSLAVVTTTPLFRTRAEKYDAVIDLPAARGVVRLRVLPSITVEGAHYQASLARIKDDDTSDPGVAIEDLRPNSDDGFVDVFADSSLLVPGRYRLVLTPQAAGGDKDTFIIKVSSPH